MASEGGGRGGVGGGTWGEEVGTPSGGSSLKGRVKFLCSCGGKIMPRQPDGLLKYVGGETRVIAVPRDISFSGLVKKLSSEFEGDLILKYQVIPEDLEMLVSVRTNEDLKHMFGEYDRQESGGTSKLRAFLFPVNPVLVENQNSCVDHHAAEQRYIDAVNGAVRTNAGFRVPPIVINRPTFSISDCSSPRSASPESNNADSVHHESSFMNSYGRHPMHKVHNSPGLYSPNTSLPQSSNLGGNNHHLYQPHRHLYQQHLPLGCQHVQPSHDHPHRLSPASSFESYDVGRAPTGCHGIDQWHSCRRKMGSGNSNKYAYLEEHVASGCGAANRPDGLPQSPRNKILG